MRNLLSWVRDDGYSCGRRDFETLDSVEELKARVVEWNACTAEEAAQISDAEWEEYFKIWKIGESEGISDDESDSI